MINELQIEPLELRRCMASVMQNTNLPLDVDQSGLVSAVDALQVVNWLNRHSDSALPTVRGDDDSLVDTNGDGHATALDALLIINAIDQYSDDLTLIGNWDRESDPNGNGVILKDSVSFVGLTVPGVRVEWLSPDGNVASGVDSVGADGQFMLSAAVDVGTHDIDIVPIDPLGRRLETTRRIQRGDLSLDWNATALNVVREWTGTSDDPYRDRIVPSEPPRVARNLAMIHTAMFDAVSSIEGGYNTYLANLNPPHIASSTAAVASAAYTVAVNLYPEADETAYWNATLAESLAIVAEGQAKQAGIEFGRAVGEAMLALRAGDEANSLFDYTPGTEPGDWDRTYPNYIPPLLPQWQAVTPFALDSPDQFRPDAPPALESQEYADAVDEVMQVGRLNSPTRTAEQTEIAVFWADGAGTYTSPGHFNQIAADVVLTREHSLLENARTFALLNIALADAAISSWDAKYHHDLWRPIDAIREADRDGNEATIPDEAWLPLLLNPPFPTYTSGHSTFGGAADSVLTALLGDNVAFTSQIDAQNSPGQQPLPPDQIITRSFGSFAHAAEENGISRVYGGVHFGFDNTAGLEAGRAIGQLVIDNFLLPASQN